MAGRKKDTAIVPVTGGALTAPNYMKTGTKKGAEDIGREDLTMPRLALAQKLSPEIEEGNAKFVPGLKFGDSYNTLSGEVYGKDPVEVVIIRAEKPKFIEFNPIDSGGGIKDYNVPAGDPRTQFAENGDKPIATKFLEYVALIGPDFRMPIAISFKGSGLKSARLLNGLIKLRNLDAFASRFRLTPAVESKGSNSWTVFNVALSGNVDEDTFAYASAVYDSISGQVLGVEKDVEGNEAPAADAPF